MMPPSPFPTLLGIMYFRYSDQTTKFVNSWLHELDVKPDYWDQDAFNVMTRSGWDPSKKVRLTRAASLGAGARQRGAKWSPHEVHIHSIAPAVYSFIPITRGFFSVTMTRCTSASYLSPSSAGATRTISRSCTRYKKWSPMRFTAHFSTGPTLGSGTG